MSTPMMAEPPEMQLIRGPLSKRATSVEFNEWQAREIASYVDRLAAALSSQAAEIAELRKALDRQCDNMAFVLNHAELYNWTEKFDRELTEDRAALTRKEG